VFQDNATRRVTTEHLMGLAAQERGIQFILLTPQDISTIRGAFESVRQRLHEESLQESGQENMLPDDFLRVLVMKPARSNATTAG